MDLDLLLAVASRTALSPSFTFLLPLFLRFQEVPTADAFFRFSVGWFLFTFVLWLARYLSVLWRNGSTKRIEWDDQVVLVTGGASGIGALLATTLALRSVSVVVLDTKKCHFDNDNIHPFVCDISDPIQIEAVHPKIISQVGHPTIIVNNAAVVNGKTILDLDVPDVQRTFAVNALSHFYILKTFLPHLISTNSGHVFTISSVLGEVGVAQLADYCASKAAIIALHESLRYELDKRYKAPKVRTSLVLLGHVSTSLFGHISFATSPMTRFLAPLLSTHSVVKYIIRAMDNQHSTTIRMPFYVSLTPVLRMLPSYLRDFFQWLSDADNAMLDFKEKDGGLKVE